MGLRPTRLPRDLLNLNLQARMQWSKPHRLPRLKLQLETLAPFVGLFAVAQIQTPEMTETVVSCDVTCCLRPAAPGARGGSTDPPLGFAQVGN